jgi:hypothetical protein
MHKILCEELKHTQVISKKKKINPDLKMESF